MVQLEVRSTTVPKEAAKQQTGKHVELRIDADAKDNWTVDSDSRGSKGDSTVVQASSSGFGASTLTISGHGAPEEAEIVIVITIIPKD